MRKTMIILAVAVSQLVLTGTNVLNAQDITQAVAPRDGWQVIETAKPFDILLGDLRAAVAEAGFGVVTQAGPTGAARNRGIDIPENRVVGVFNNIFAVRVLELSTAAMIEAPIRFYMTEGANGTATLSWKTPSLVFSPYFDEGGPALVEAAAELDEIFQTIADAAAG